MLILFIRFLRLVILILLITACNAVSNKPNNEARHNTNERDSIFILTIIDEAYSDQETRLSFYLDTLNSMLSVIGEKRQIVNSYRCYSIIPGESIEYENNIEGHVKLLLKGGLIEERVFEGTDGSVKHEYDSLQHLKNIVYTGGRKTLSWDGDYLNKVIYTDSTAQRFNQLMNVLYDSDNHSEDISIELLNRIVAESRYEFLFTYIGLYGHFPKGNSYSIEDITYDYKGLENKKTYVCKELYSSDGLLVKSYQNLGNKDNTHLRCYSWNYPNLKLLSIFLKKKKGKEYKE